MEQWLDQLENYPAWSQAFILALSTLGSEDLTTIVAGMLVAEKTLSPLTALLGCFFGIYIGDGLLYVLGYGVGRPALKLPILRNMLKEEKVDACARWFEENGMVVVISSRFLPGTRLPTYFAAGLVGASPWRFGVATAVAVGLWTPLLLGVSWFFGEELLEMLEATQEYKWPLMIVSILLIFAIVRLMLKLGDWRLRRRMRSRFRRFTDWEFWPLSVVYAPVVLYNLLLMIRYRRGNYPLVSNPGIEYSGFVGESKNTIMADMGGITRFTAQFLPMTARETVDEKVSGVAAWLKELDLDYPLMMKPDVGQRGDGVQKVNSEVELRAYLETCEVDVQAQEFLPGPYEFGISYRRYPWEEKGQVMGLTGKEFPKVVGDGHSSLRDLILRNPLCMGRVHIFFERFSERLEEVLPKGEVVELVRAGNHCLGTLFNDSSYLLTEALAERVDEISKAIPGFYIGRFDVRTSDLPAFRAGESFKIMELNGASAEPSYAYDPRHNIWQAYKMFFAHYHDLWRIGAYNAKHGHKPPSIRVLIKAARDYQELARHQAEVH